MTHVSINRNFVMILQRLKHNPVMTMETEMYKAIQKKMLRKALLIGIWKKLCKMLRDTSVSSQVHVGKILVRLYSQGVLRY